MIWVDYLILVFIAASALISLVRGFVREALSLATWVLGFWIAFSFTRDLAFRLESWIPDETIRLGVAFLALLILTLIVGAFVNHLIASLVQKTGLTGTDRTLGVLFGLVRGAAIVAALVLLAGLTTLPQEDWWDGALLLSHFEDVALWLARMLPGGLEEELIFAP